MLQQGCSDWAVKKFQVDEWHKRFHVGRERVDYDPRSGRPSEPINEARLSVCAVGSDRRTSVDQMASVVGISLGSCHGILLDVLKVRHVCEHAVPRMLTTEQKETRMYISGDLIGMGGEEKFFNNK
jgi:hypothetical protein